MFRKSLIVAALAAASTVWAGATFAHGEKPKQGGALQVVGDVAFELVPKGDAAVIYVEDHGKPVSTAGMSGKLTVLNGTEKSEAELKPAGDNRLEAKGVKLVKGSKAVASVTAPGKKAVSARFAVK